MSALADTFGSRLNRVERMIDAYLANDWTDKEKSLQLCHVLGNKNARPIADLETRIEKFNNLMDAARINYFLTLDFFNTMQLCCSEKWPLGEMPCDTVHKSKKHWKALEEFGIMPPTKEVATDDDYDDDDIFEDISWFWVNKKPELSDASKVPLLNGVREKHGDFFIIK
jgi:hypothetical protein